MGRILIIEDDSTWCQWLETSIKRDLAELWPEVEVVESEAEFVLKWVPGFDAGSKKRPDIIVLDIMLRWTDPDPEQSPRPPNVVEGGFMRAGLRCLDMIKRHGKLSKSHVIIVTVLSQEDLSAIGGNPRATDFVQKNNGEAVLRRIRSALLRIPA